MYQWRLTASAEAGVTELRAAVAVFSPRAGTSQKHGSCRAPQSSGPAAPTRRPHVAPNCDEACKFGERVPIEEVSNRATGGATEMAADIPICRGVPILLEAIRTEGGLHLPGWRPFIYPPSLPTHYYSVLSHNCNAIPAV